ncbi:MAG: undecaprenyl-phosphate alpha-N-acetylglucosaminyl 1-phosphate transferase [Sphingobacteriales bacterium]|nr:undecaprenyl-phosphate alpha-N-acetylglucosaminyl 1-phosphate transferase [Sphingobacteriales bacterium]
MYESLLNNDPLYYGIVVFFSLLIVVIAIPSIIHVANICGLYDDHSKVGKNHKYGISRLGGVAVFFSFIITSLLFSKTANFQTFNYLLVSCVILFAVGLKDDLTGVHPSTKFAMQFIVALIMVFLGDVRLTSMYSVLNIYELPYIWSVLISITIIMFIINAFNLIDGIDGLVGVTGLTVCLILGVMFTQMEQPVYACIAFSIVGASGGFLFFNLTPAKIFMGDTGSLLIGFISAILSLKFIELNKVNGVNIVFYNAAPSISVAVLIGPIYDAIRVFVIRIFNKNSPFIGDNNHIHHKMLLLGLTHLQTTLLLITYNIAIFFITISLRHFGNFFLIGMLFAICILFNFVLMFLIRSKNRKVYKFVNFFL